MLATIINIFSSKVADRTSNSSCKHNTKNDDGNKRARPITPSLSAEVFDTVYSRKNGNDELDTFLFSLKHDPLDIFLEVHWKTHEICQLLLSYIRNGQIIRYVIILLLSIMDQQ
mmetsp:Transcript_23333/g.36013  ORF Transcript_23333/g.36013 Transcript_23333/m.36013 type:complete len:114 (+) Transcript_23333:2315-2656(+)